MVYVSLPRCIDKSVTAQRAGYPISRLPSGDINNGPVDLGHFVGGFLDVYGQAFAFPDPKAIPQLGTLTAVNVFRDDCFLIVDISDLILFIKLGQYFHTYKISIPPAEFNGFEIFRRDDLIDDIGAAADQLVDKGLMVIIKVIVMICLLYTSRCV